MIMKSNIIVPVDGIAHAEKAARDKALRVLQMVKEREKKEEFITVRVDKITVKLIPRKKAIKLGIIKE